MPLEEDRIWSPEVVVTLDEIVERMAEYRPLVEIPHARSETARRYRFDDGIGEIGIIAPVSHPFCGHCSRVRLTSDGKIRTCLFSVWDHDLHGQMRRGATDAELEALHHARRSAERSPPPHRRAGLRARLPHHGAHRRLIRTRALSRRTGHRATMPMSSRPIPVQQWRDSRHRQRAMPKTCRADLARGPHRVVLDFIRSTSMNFLRTRTLPTRNPRRSDAVRDRLRR